MSWRTVIISKRCKLDLKMGYMVIRGEDTKRIFLDEVAMVVIENPAVSLTGCLLEALVEKKVRVIFCDSKRLPMAELSSYYGSHDCSRKIKTQFSWDDAMKQAVWREIVAEKIKNQSDFLFELGKNRESDLLKSYIDQIEMGDITNREGHAAKVYFNGVFGMSFTRSAECVTNAALNYGYSILLSSVSREIIACGYLTQLGIFHDNMFNQFNLSCDLLEPFRVLVDRHVFYSQFDDFQSKEKYSLWNILNMYVFINGCKQTVMNGLKLYTKSVFEALNDRDVSRIKFFSLVKEEI